MNSAKNVKKIQIPSASKLFPQKGGFPIQKGVALREFSSRAHEALVTFIVYSFHPRLKILDGTLSTGA